MLDNEDNSFQMQCVHEHDVSVDISITIILLKEKKKNNSGHAHFWFWSEYRYFVTTRILRHTLSLPNMNSSPCGVKIKTVMLCVTHCALKPSVWCISLHHCHPTWRLEGREEADWLRYASQKLHNGTFGLYGYVNKELLPSPRSHYSYMPFAAEWSQLLTGG